ncbi:MAG: hypothetical protein LQ347_006502 [Umbilicaria vellea]|nr:MAG: hypothetical protein LQ347_006502 [Umbilicaria vellea]
MASYMNNVTLIDLLTQYPIVRALAQELPFAGLLNLARLNTHYRNILHGFSLEIMDPDHCMDKNGARQGLHLGEHETRHWRNLKSLSQMICSEPQHTKGSNPRGCRMCSKPVCEGCIVKASFGKHEKTFQNRRRYLCPDCWTTSNPPRESPIEPLSISKPVSYTPCYEGALVFQGYCSCTARDSWLCLECKTAQRPDSEVKAKICAGQSCSNPLHETMEELRACLWCHLPLNGRPTWGELRRDYDSRYLYARLNSDTWSADDEYVSSSTEQDFPLLNTTSDGRKVQRSVIPYAEQRYSPFSIPLLADSVGLTFDSPPKLKVREPQPLQNLMLIDYSALGVPPPLAERMVDSFFGIFRYDPSFLLAFRPLCHKKPTRDWESRVNTILRSDDIGLNAGWEDDDHHQVPDLDDGHGGDQATLRPDDDDSDGDKVTLATPRMSLDYALMPRSSWL